MKQMDVYSHPSAIHHLSKKIYYGMLTPLYRRAIMLEVLLFTDSCSRSF